MYYTIRQDKTILLSTVNLAYLFLIIIPPLPEGGGGYTGKQEVGI
jgi:hypothetical protein